MWMSIVYRTISVVFFNYFYKFLPLHQPQKIILLCGIAVGDRMFWGLQDFDFAQI